MALLLHKTAKAIADAATAKAFAWLQTARPELSRGNRDDDDSRAPASNELPALIVQTGGYRAIQPGDATAYVVVSMHLHQQADDTAQETAMERASELGEWIIGSDFRSDLNAIDGFHCIGIGTISQEFELVGRRWQTTFTFEMLATPSNL